MNTLILTVGLPRSGKSTWARRQGIPIVNPDAIRLAVHGKPFLKESEALVWTIAEYMVKSLFLAGHDKVILDATSTTHERRIKWMSTEWRLRHKKFTTAKDICIQRAHETGKPELVGVIERMSKDIEFPGRIYDY